MAAQQDTTNLLEKYKGAEGGDTAVQTRQKIMNSKPEWAKFDATKSNAGILTLLDADTPAITTKAIIQGHHAILQGCMDATTLQDVRAVQWILTFLYDMLREDSSCYSLFEVACKNQVDFQKPLMALLNKQAQDTYVSDKAAWLLSALVAHIPLNFTENDVQAIVTATLASTCSEIGTLDAITNLLKSDVHRKQVWAKQGVSDVIFKVEPKTANSEELYKCVFSIWMLSFDQEIIAELKTWAVVTKLRDSLTNSRSEKVCRLCLTVLRNLLEHKGLCEEIAEEGVLEAVQQLEFEKWRDAELYDDIRDMAQQICIEVSELSNYDRYERELQTGKLSWGFIHSSRFWAENVMKFDQNDFRSLKVLAGMIQSCNSDPTTLAVACHDLGEFVALHPVGKKQVAKLGVKERVMQLMGSTDANYREVRREALLCCQKMMLNNWRDAEKAQAK